jgi:hypothetical protein
MQDFQDRQRCLPGQAQELLIDMEFSGGSCQLALCLYLGKMSNHQNISLFIKLDLACNASFNVWRFS